MRYLILALALTLPLSVGAFKPEDLEELKKTHQCPNCDLEGADLREANLYEAKLQFADLKGADLKGAYLGGADLKEAFFCETTMPDGTKNNTDCP